MSVLGTEGVVPIFATLAASGVETGTGVARAVSLSQNWVVTHTRRGVLTVEQQRGTAEPSSFSPAAEAPLLCWEREIYSRRQSKGAKETPRENLPKFWATCFQELVGASSKNESFQVCYGEKSAVAESCCRHGAVRPLPACGHWPVPVRGLIPSHVPVGPPGSWGWGFDTDSRDPKLCLVPVRYPGTPDMSSFLWPVGGDWPGVYASPPAHCMEGFGHPRRWRVAFFLACANPS